MALSENSEKWAIGVDLSVLPFLGVRAPVSILRADVLSEKIAECLVSESCRVPGIWGWYAN